MAKKSRVLRNNNILRVVSNQSANRVALKQTLTNKEGEMKDRLKASFALQRMPRDGAKVRFRNRCNSCGRSRYYLRYFGLCRLCIIKYRNQGLLYGVVSSSW